VKLQIKYGKLSSYFVEKLITYFVVDIAASKTAEVMGLNRKTVDAYYHLFRVLIYEQQTKAFGKLAGKIEFDESYVGARRLRGKHLKLKRGRGTYKQPVFGLYKRGGRVYTEIIPNCSKAVLQTIITRLVALNATVNSDGWTGYDGLVDVGYDKHYRVNHSVDEFSDGRGHTINGIESFWSFTKRRLQHANGIRKTHFALFLKECEWRYQRTHMQLEQALQVMVQSYVERQTRKGLDE
jgi:transposase-like protein